jgi:hypothetical protein
MKQEEKKDERFRERSSKTQYFLSRAFTEKTSLGLVVLGILTAIVGIGLFGFNIDVGKLGDYIGGIAGSIWALAGVILFYVALLAQKDALRDQQKATQTNADSLNKQIEALNFQKEELVLQREELQATRAVFTEQSQTLKLQQFETTFFNLLNTHREVLNNIVSSEMDPVLQREKEPKVLVYGNSALFNIWMVFLMRLAKWDNVPEDKVDEVYFGLTKDYRPFLEPYFMTVYHMMKFIDRAEIYDKLEYARLYRAQLTVHELKHLFYDCRLPIASKLKALMEKYNMFTRLQNRDVVDERHKEAFSKSAFIEY